MNSIFKWLYRKTFASIFPTAPIIEMLTMVRSILLHRKFSFVTGKLETDKEKLEYYLVKHCHIVEKGLALPEPRKGFGQPKITDLIEKARLYEKKYPVSHITLMIRDTLREYIAFHESDLEVLPREFLDNVEGFISEQAPQNKGGLIKLRKSEIKTYGGDSFEQFLKSRHSIRNFSELMVDESTVFRALEISLNTPSVCNRQGWFVHYYSDKRIIRELLAYQNGNAGFTENIDKLLIVTASIKAFTRFEHNQLFVDGGLYSMNLMLALHAVGLGSCPLNTCMSWFKETSLKQKAGIPEHERLIMMVAVGNLKDEFSVAKSDKYTVEKVVRQK